MARILIAGCGWLGEALGAVLHARGDAVWGLRRNAALLPASIEPVAADLDDAAAVAAAIPAALDAVVYAAAPDGGDEAAYERIYVRGLRNVLDAVRRSSGPIPTVLLSSTSVYGQTSGEWVDESSPTEPGEFRGRTVLAGERILAASGHPAIALRLGGLYGPGRTSLIDTVLAGRAVVSSGPARFTNRIHRDDAAAAVVHLLGLLGLLGPRGGAYRGATAHDEAARHVAAIYIGVDEEPADRDDVVRWLARRLGVGVVEGHAEPGRARAGTRAPSGGREASDRRDTNKRCSSARLRASGYRFRYPTYREGYEALLEGRRQAPSLLPEPTA